MPKQRQIPRLFAQRLADGTTVWHWKPSKTLRTAGFVNVKLGVDRKAAFAEADRLNEQVEAWRAGAADMTAIAAAPAPPRHVRFAELVRRFRESDAFADLRDSTRHEYDTRLRQLTRWALDGDLPIRQIDAQMVRDLRNGLVAKASPWIAASTLRVLRLLLGWAKREGLVADNVARECDIPEPPARKVRMEGPVRAAIVEAAEALGLDMVSLGVELAFWMVQRQADVLNLNRMAWREVSDIEPRDAGILADAKGRVKAFRLCQQKTGTWIDAPLPPFLHEAVESRMRASNSGWLFAHPDKPDAAMPAWMFQRRFREAQGAAYVVAIGRGDAALAAAIDACQFRDLRRTGMIYYRDCGVKIDKITALSGHYVIGKKTILDTYMPGDTAGACTCVATGVAHYLERQQRKAI